MKNDKQMPFPSTQLYPVVGPIIGYRAYKQGKPDIVRYCVEKDRMDIFIGYMVYQGWAVGISAMLLASGLEAIVRQLQVNF